MKAELLLRAILPDVLIDNFDIVSFEGQRIFPVGGEMSEYSVIFAK